MCFYFTQSQSAISLENRFNARFEFPLRYKPLEIYQAFTFPYAPVITHDQPDKIQLFQWGLIPSWSKNKDIQKFTLNAQIETVQSKVSFKNSVNKRCLIPAESFWEWQWLDVKGHRKQKYELFVENKQIFAFAGLWSDWIHVETGELIQTFTILTMQANEIMSKIHNVKKRMPVILSPDNERIWLKGGELKTWNEHIIPQKCNR